MYLVLFLAGGIVISEIEELPLIFCLFEMASAIGTVGLSLGITPTLGLISRAILIVLMFFGRVGGLTIIFAAVSAAHHNISKKEALSLKAKELQKKQFDISAKLSIIKYLSEEKEMKYQAVVKELPETVVYSEERRLKDYSEVMVLVLESAEECLRLNPGLECTKPDYCFCEYLDGEYKESNILVRYSQAVVKKGVENERVKFRTLSKTKAICIYHKGPYDRLGDAYAYITEYAKKNGYKIASFPRESYIDGIWNKENTDKWLTEIHLPIE